MIITPGMQNMDQVDPNLETNSGKPDIARMKEELEDVKGTASRYFQRVGCALDWWFSRWDGQSIDGRRWWKFEGQSDPFPWPGSSDTRVRLTKSIVNEYRTICMYALMNMKLQAKSTRPAATMREAQQATTLLNWQIFTHMQEEWYRESELAIVWAGALGSSVMAVDWRQERRLDMVPINVMQFAQWVGQQIGRPINLLQMQSLLEDKSSEKELIGFIQDMSEIVTTGKARSILRDLQQLRTAEIPVPQIFISRPSLMALRPMIDVFFSPEADDLQRERWVDRVEYVTETVLKDRIETDGYDPAFCDAAAKQKGVYSTYYGYESAFRDFGYGYNIITPGNRPDASSLSRENGLIELHHFYHYSLDYGVPCLYRTVFHMELDDFAITGPSEYAHGQMPFHSFRFETDQRSILSSQGIAALTYTWENEYKAQIDARTDLASLKLAPPMFSPLGDEEKWGSGFRPNAIIPTLPGRTPSFAPTPPYDPGPVEICNDIMQRAANFFGWFGLQVDPQLKQMRQMETADRAVIQFKPVVNQIAMLDDQFLPDDVWLRVTGIPAPQGVHDPQQIRNQYEMSMTCDIRELDNEFLKQKFAAISAILPWDTVGVINRTPLIQNALGSIDYTLSDMVISQPEDATNKQITDEIQAVSLIIGSGVEQPLPPMSGTNFGVRLQTLNNIVSQPLTKMRLANDKAATAALENRALYYQRQERQAQNAQIGRVQVQSTTNPTQAPMLQAPGQGASAQ